MNKRVFARIAREHGPKLLEQAIKSVAAAAVVQDEVSDEQEKPKKPSLRRRVAHAALVRVATRSVPGAILISGGLIAKALHDRHKARGGGVPGRRGLVGKLRR